MSIETLCQPDRAHLDLFGTVRSSGRKRCCRGNVSAIKVRPPHAFYLASLRLNSFLFLLMAEKKDQSSHGALPHLEPAKRVLQ